MARNSVGPMSTERYWQKGRNGSRGKKESCEDKGEGKVIAKARPVPKEGDQGVFASIDFSEITTFLSDPRTVPMLLLTFVIVSGLIIGFRRQFRRHRREQEDRDLAKKRTEAGGSSIDE